MEKEYIPVSCSAPDITGDDLDEEDKDSIGSMDIAEFVTEVERFSKLVEPAAFVMYGLEDVRRWRYPTLTVTLWILCNLGCWILTQGAAFALVALLVISIATVCLCQLHTRILDKILPETTVDSDCNDNCVDDATTLETVREFRYSLIQMNDFIVKCNEYMTHFYAILKWDDMRPSLRFHVEACTLLLSLVVLPTRWIIFLVLNWFFLANEDMCQIASKYLVLLINRAQGKEAPTDDLSANNAHSDHKECSNHLKTDDDDMSDKDDCSETEADVGSANATNDSASKTQTSKPGMVARLLELKRRRQHIANESCFGCKVSFSSILKRRYYCRHCGHNFCARCCRQKVPRSVFGATSPAAQTETVLVCTICYDLLTKSEDKDKNS